jgi:hypothetical protein
MIVPSSAIRGGSPRRLFLHAGKWVLEIVRQVNLGQDLIRPATERLTGQRAIVAYFKNNPEKAQLGKATQRLMQSALEGETLSYTAEGVDWIANSIPPPPDRRGSYEPAAQPPSLETVVSDLEARVVVLTAVQEGLLTRLARLEAKIAQGVVLAESRARPEERGDRGPERRAPDSDDERTVGEKSADPDSSDAEFDSALKKGPAGSPQRGRAASSASSEDEAALSEREAGASRRPEPEPKPVVESGPAPILLTLPPVPELTKCVALLIGGDVTAKEGDPPLAINRTTRECYVAGLLDDSDQTVGMILMDLRAAVFLGGTLMMLPRTEIEQQLKALSPGEDSIAASAEICNALSGAINGFQDQHVRVGGLQKFEFKAWSWVTEPYERRDLEDSFGGRTVVISRAPQVQIG